MWRKREIMNKHNEDDDIQEYIRPWVGLTDEEISKIIEMGLGVRDSIKTALDKFKEKNR